VGLPPKKIAIFLRPVKDDLGLKRPDVCSAPWDCGQVYIGQTGRSIETRVKEHLRHTRLEQPDISAVAEHSINLGHRIKLQDTAALSVDRMVREAIEIEIDPNMSRENGLHLSRAWKSLIHTFRGRRNLRVQHRQSLLGH
jgi:hypothetical protein